MNYIHGECKHQKGEKCKSPKLHGEIWNYNFIRSKSQVYNKWKDSVDRLHYI